ncbi:hypothetical protein AOLI_G00249990, partial [Acnodon oligacanthus]
SSEHSVIHSYGRFLIFKLNFIKNSQSDRLQTYTTQVTVQRPSKRSLIRVCPFLFLGNELFIQSRVYWRELESKRTLG